MRKEVARRRGGAGLTPNPFPQREGELILALTRSVDGGIYMPLMGRTASPEKRQRAKELRETSTPAESLLWERLRRSGVGFHFRRQHPLLGFIPDFYCHPARLVVELDGAVHDDQMEYDAQRDVTLRDAGLLVLRFTNDAVESDIERVLEKIADTCRVRSPNPSREEKTS